MRITTGLTLLLCCAVLAACGGGNPYTYVKGAALTCAMRSDQGPKPLTWRPGLGALVYDGRTLPVLRERSNRRGLTIETQLWDFDAVFLYSGQTGQGTISVASPEGGIFLTGPCAVGKS